MFSIWEDPKGNTYSQLIDYSIEKCSYFTLTVSEQLHLSDKGKRVLDQLKCFLIKSEREEFGLHEKYGRITYYYRCEPDSALVLKGAADSLYSWVQPMLPEDLCFYTQMDKCWLSTVAHEGMGDFNAGDEEAFNIMKNIKGLSLTGEFNNTTEALIRDAKRWQTETLNISDDSLEYLPEEFKELVSLKSLKIHGKRFKELPGCIGNLTDLEEISILSYEFGKVPIEIGKLNKLKKFMLWGSYCSAEELAENGFVHRSGKCPLRTLPKGIGNLRSLEFLELNSTSMEELPREVGLLKGLRWLSVNNGDLKVIPDEMGNLKSLEHLGIGDNQIEYLPEGLGCLTNLKGLDIKNNNIKKLPESISNLINITYIDVENNPLVNDESEMNRLKDMPGLESIYI